MNNFNESMNLLFLFFSINIKINMKVNMKIPLNDHIQICSDLKEMEYTAMINNFYSNLNMCKI